MSDEFIKSLLTRLAILELNFRETFKNYEVFGDKAFQIYEEKRYNISLAYFDILSVILSDYPFRKVKEKKNKIADAFENLRKNREYTKSTTFPMLNAELTKQALDEAMR